MQVYMYIETAPSLEEACKLYYKSRYKKVEIKDAIDPQAKVLLFKLTTEIYTFLT